MKKNYMKISVLSVAAVLGVWIVGSALNCFNPTFIPSVKDVLDAFRNLWENGYKGYSLMYHIAASMKRLGIAMVLVFIAGTALGVACGMNRKILAAVDSFIQFYRALPPLAYNTPKKITLGYWESPNGELLTKEKGSLEAAFPDTDIEWVEFQSGTDILTTMQSGSIDFATIGTPPAALGLAKDYPFKIFYLHDIIGESEGLVVKKDSGISSVKDLKGKKIATTFASTSHFSLLSALEAEGLSETDVTLYDMSAPDMYASWQRGEIDGVYVWEPVKSQLLDNEGTEIVSSEEMAEKGALTAEVGIVSNSFYEKYPDVVKSILIFWMNP